MPLNPQTHPFPPLDQVERSWDKNITASLRALYPGPYIGEGLKLGFPLSAGQPTTGFLPTMTNGYLVDGDMVAGPYGASLITATTANQVNTGLWFGLKGVYYAANAATPKDVLLGRLSTNATSIQHIGQQYRASDGMYVIRGVVNLAQCARAADTALFTWTKPTTQKYSQVVYSHVRIETIVTAGNTTGDDFLLKLGSTTLLTKAAANLVTLDHTDATTSAAAVSTASTLTFNYNFTDTSTAIAGGTMEVIALIRTFG